MGCWNCVGIVYLCNLITRKLSDLLLSNSTVVNNAIDKAPSMLPCIKLQD